MHSSFIGCLRANNVSVHGYSRICGNEKTHRSNERGKQMSLNKREGLYAGKCGGKHYRINVNFECRYSSPPLKYR